MLPPCPEDIVFSFFCHLSQNNRLTKFKKGSCALRCFVCLFVYLFIFLVLVRQNFLMFYEPLRNGLFPRFPKDMLALSTSPHTLPCSNFFHSHGLPVQFRVPVQVMPLL